MSSEILTKATTYMLKFDLKCIKHKVIHQPCLKRQGISSLLLKYALYSREIVLLGGLCQHVNVFLNFTCKKLQ